MKKQDLLELIANGENSRVELKLDRVRPEQLAKEVLALTNLKGGHILLGVADDKSIAGITREQLLMLGSASGYIHAEIMPVQRTSFDALDRSRLENYLKDILKDPDAPETRDEWIARLKALGLVTEGPAGASVCTIAGLVLFGIRPRQVMKQSGLRLMFFDALDKIYQAQLDKVVDAPLVGRFQVGQAGRSLIDAGLIEKALESMEPFVTRESDTIDEHFRRDKQWQVKATEDFLKMTVGKATAAAVGTGERPGTAPNLVAERRESVGKDSTTLS